MGTTCAVASCTVAPFVAGATTSCFDLLCKHHVLQLWKRYIDAKRGGVPNPVYDVQSEEDFRRLKILPLNSQSQRLRNLSPVLMFRPGTELATIKQAAPIITAAVEGRKKRVKANNDAKAAEVEETIAAAGEMVDLSKDEIQNGCRAIATINNKIVDPNEDLVSISKVKVIPVPEGRNKVQANESTRKYRYPDAALLLDDAGGVPHVDPNSNEIATVEVDTIKEFRQEVASFRRNGGAEVLLVSMQLCKETTTKSARKLEKMGQNLFTSNNIPPYHTEDDVYRKGNSADPAAVTITVAVGALESVRTGPFYFSSSVPSFFERRMKKYYSWARDDDLWRDEATSARQRKLEYARARNAARAARKKAKTAA